MVSVGSSGDGGGVTGVGGDGGGVQISFTCLTHAMVLSFTFFMCWCDVVFRT